MKTRSHNRGRTYANARREASVTEERLKQEIAGLRQQNKGLRQMIAGMQRLQNPRMKFPTVNQGMDGGMMVNCRNQPNQSDWEVLVRMVNIHLRNLPTGYVI